MALCSMKDLIIKKSKIHGRGVFAGKDFKKGEAVVRWEFKKKFLKKDIDSLPRKDLKYVSRLNKKYFVVVEGTARFVNHSDDSNTVAVKGVDVALHTIKAGEEITSNYIAESACVDFVCNCGKKDCCKKYG